MGNLILNDIIYYNICGENINLDIVKAIFPQKLNENERCYSFNNPKVRWVSKIYSSGFSDGNIQSICHNIKERKSVILIFGENDAEGHEFRACQDGGLGTFPSAGYSSGRSH